MMLAALALSSCGGDEPSGPTEEVFVLMTINGKAIPAQVYVDPEGGYVKLMEATLTLESDGHYHEVTKFEQFTADGATTGLTQTLAADGTYTLLDADLKLQSSEETSVYGYELPTSKAGDRIQMTHPNLDETVDGSDELIFARQ
jgi:hypothetical protein